MSDQAPKHTQESHEDFADDVTRRVLSVLADACEERGGDLAGDYPDCLSALSTAIEVVLKTMTRGASFADRKRIYAKTLDAMKDTALARLRLEAKQRAAAEWDKA